MKRFTLKFKLLIPIFLITIVFGGVFAGVKKARALDCQATCTYGCNTLIGACYDSPDSNPLISNPAPKQSFQPNETPSAQTVPGADSATQVTDEKYETTMKKQGGIYYIVGYIVGKILEFMTGLVEWAIRFGNDATQLPIVKNGWSIILSFTNLGFVLAIIVIAFSTILQIQNYAMKKVLWKLIVAALLVNFSLVIAGSLLDASNFVTVMILNKINSGNLASAFGSALQPQSLFPPKDTNSFLSVLSAIFSPASFLLKHLASIIFIIIFTFLAILTLLTVFIMFMVRAANIIFLLMLSPIIWLCWIFPSTHKYWKQWWDKFIRWLVFAPASVFFMYLAIAAMINGPGGGTALDSTNNLTNQAADPNSAVGAFSNSLLLANDFVAHVANMLIFIVIIVGGLFVANSFGIAGGQLGINIAEKTGKGVGRWAGRKGKMAGTALLRKKRGEGEEAKTVSERLTKRGEGKGFIKRHAYGWMARGAAKLEKVGGEDLVKQASGKVGKMSLVEKKAALLTADAPRRIAILEDLAASKDSDGIELSRYLTQKQKQTFKAYGRGVKFGDVEKAAMRSVEMVEAAAKGDLDALTTATDKFVGSLKIADLAKAQWNDIYKRQPVFGLDKKSNDQLVNNLTGALAQVIPGSFNKILPQIKGDSMKNFSEVVATQLAFMERSTDGNIIKAAEKARNSLKQNMTWLALGITPEETKKTEPTGPPAGTTGTV